MKSPGMCSLWEPHCRTLLLFLLSSAQLWAGMDIGAGWARSGSCDKSLLAGDWHPWGPWCHSSAAKSEHHMRCLLPYCKQHQWTEPNAYHTDQDAWFWSVVQLQICFVTLIYIWKDAFYQLQSALGKLGSPEDSCHGSAHYSTTPATKNVSAQVWMWCTGSNAGVSCI